jgi:tRNA (guanine37-N1)-methyltransferase
MRFDVVTIFPGIFDAFLRESILGKARERGLVDVRVHDLRAWTTDRHKVTDDYPYGGGAGMVMKPEPLSRAIAALKEERRGGPVVLMSPQGERFTQEMATEMAGGEGAVVVCGRYEGIDERIVELLVDREISIGDYVLNGGEVPAMAVIEAVSRLVPGVVGSEESTRLDSFSGGLLEHPHYTRPAEFMGRRVPDVLLSGNHAEIERWRRRQSLRRTAARRPDLLARLALSAEDRALLEGGEQDG